MSSTVNTEPLHKLINPRPGFHFRMEMFLVNEEAGKFRSVKFISDEKVVPVLEAALKQSGGDVKGALALIEQEMKKAKR